MGYRSDVHDGTSIEFVKTTLVEFVNGIHVPHSRNITENHLVGSY